MTHLDILAVVLSEVTNRPAWYWRDVIRNTVAAAGRDIATTSLLESVPPPEAEKLLTEMRAEKAGILRWLVAGSQAARQEKPAARFKLSAYLSNLQN